MNCYMNTGKKRFLVYYTSRTNVAAYNITMFFIDNPTNSEVFHQEFNPPADGSYTGLGKQEKVVPVTDPSNDREQVQQRYRFQSQ